jgi:hypothetical protein
MMTFILYTYFECELEVTVVHLNSVGCKVFRVYVDYQNFVIVHSLDYYIILIIIIGVT